MYGVVSPMKGKKHTKASLEHQSKIKKGSLNPRYGQEVSQETRKRLSESLKGHPTPEETRKKISETLKNNPTFLCKHCNKSFKASAYKGFHR